MKKEIKRVSVGQVVYYNGRKAVVSRVDGRRFAVAPIGESGRWVKDRDTITDQ